MVDFDRELPAARRSNNKTKEYSVATRAQAVTLWSLGKSKIEDLEATGMPWQTVLRTVKKAKEMLKVLESQPLKPRCRAWNALESSGNPLKDDSACMPSRVTASSR